MQDHEKGNCEAKDMNEVTEHTAGRWVACEGKVTDTRRMVDIVITHKDRPDHPDIRGLLHGYRSEAPNDPTHRDMWDLYDFVDEALACLTDRAPCQFLFLLEIR
ncbi:hypothetical protein ACFU99_19785 [Streptomyces sp. NPDC057654]|uniref:hypothetical protein n=1 Tax=Streptomyces sp. NPDC057654 TaxID=3346196 RepID=UPI0036BF3651